MKIQIASVFTFFSVAHIGLSQGFMNLDFENPILPLSPVFNTVSAANAIPGWTAYNSGSALNTIFYDTVSIGGSLVALEDANAPSGIPQPIEGNYSVLLDGPSPGLETSASIGQTGTIPTTAQSLTFIGNLFGSLQVTFNGQNISFSAIGNGANYTIYGANIASYAGQTGQLLFTSPVNSNAFGGTNYSKTPIGAVSNVEEPGLPSPNYSAAYFGLWASGKNFGICAWNARNTIYFQAVGDPFLTH